MRRLSFRLMGAFGAAILVGAVVLVLLANRVTESEFQFYITREGQQWAERLAPSLASFYAYDQSWNGVDTFLQTRGTASSPGDMGSMMNRSVIQGELEAIIDGVVPLKVESITSVHEETVLLSRLVGDLRTLSLAEVGQLKLSCETTDIVDLVERVIERMQRQAQEKAVGLKLDVPESIPSVYIDADRVAQVIRNLASNALRHTPSGGQVIVRVRSLSGAVEIGVIDTGTGIAPEDLPHVFDRFYRGPKSQPQARDGSGLGLAIVKHLVEAHGGSVGVESRVPSGRGKGARFWFTLPITPKIA